MAEDSHGGGEEDEQFQVTVTFAEQGNKTELTMRALFKSAAELDKAVKDYGAIEEQNQRLTVLRNN